MSKDKRKGRARQLETLRELKSWVGPISGLCAFNIAGFPQITRTHLDLIALGYIKRERITINARRRATCLSLTTAGERIVAAAKPKT